MYQVLHREQLSDSTFLWDVFAPDVARAAQPGQFIMLRLDEGGERIPLTIADFDRERGLITLVVQAAGKTTQHMMRRPEGSWFLDFVGPLGLPSELPARPEHVVFIGGGLGVAPVFPQVRAFKRAGHRVTAILGFRDRERVFWASRFHEWADEVVVCTDDGSLGRPGFVTAALLELLQATPPDRVVAIGPMPMMRACAETTRPFGVHTVVSLNTIMVDGTGMCGSCRVTVDGVVRFACVEGPEFDAHKVAFEELVARQRRFTGQEATANAREAHACQLERTLVVEGKRNYKKFKQISPTATPMAERPAPQRAKTFKEVNLGYTMAEALHEAERCLQCRVPTCVPGCPVGIDIPGFIRQLLIDDLAASRAVITESNLFPSVCGRVCPQESQCEALCILGKRMEPVAIGRLERFVGDHAPAPVTGPPLVNDTLGDVAIVGSGPAGLACAGDLARAGVRVTVFEALHVTGGVLRYGIPSFRLPRAIIDREVRQLQDLGVVFKTNKVIGRTFTVQQLLEREGYRAVFLGTGAGAPRFLGLHGEQAGQVYSANEFLTRVNLMGGDRFPYQDTPVGVGRRVVVIGAGNTAMDCLRVAVRLGAEVHSVYRRTAQEAPARQEEQRHAAEEGVTYHFLRSPAEVVLTDGQVSALRCEVMALGEPDASGRRRPVATGEEETLPCDTVIYALGTGANALITRSTPGLELNKWGYIVADPHTQATSVHGVFAGGDIVTGGATVILALGGGRRAARHILSYLSDPTWPPTGDPKEQQAPWTEPSCPRCHRPLSDEDVYICCADQELSWSCTSCHKLMEGFAFPYGLCPACGGTLRRETAQPDRDPDQRALRYAVELELGGIALYNAGADRTQDPQLRELFLRLAEMERAHLSALSDRYHLALEDAQPLSADHLAVHAGVNLEVSSPLELLTMALALERRARDFFASQAKSMPEGSPTWRLYRELEAEEYDHVATLETEISRRERGLMGPLEAHPPRTSLLWS